MELDKQDVIYTLIDDRGQIIHDIHPDFYKKFRTYVKLFSNSLMNNQRLLPELSIHSLGIKK